MPRLFFCQKKKKKVFAFFFPIWHIEGEAINAGFF